MKKFIYITLSAVLFFGCQNDEFYKGSGISFYPSVVGVAEEEDNVEHIILLETTGDVKEGTIKIKVEMSDAGELATDPAMDDKGIITIPVTGRSVQFTVTALNDAIPDDYTVDFRVVSAEGDVSNMGTGKYTLYVNDKDVIPVFSEDFDDCIALNAFSDYEVTGTDGWGCVSTFGVNGTGAVRANGYNSGEQEQWLISPSLDLQAFDGVSVKFFTDRSFNGPELELYVSTNYDGTGNPTEFTWTQLDPKLDGDNVTDTWTASGNVDISDFLTDSTYVAFVYKSGTEGAAQWTVDEFEVNIFRPNGSGGGNDNLVSLPYSEDFENCDSNFKPANFTIYHMTEESENLQNWRCNPSGVDGSTAVRISASGGAAGIPGASNTWLISNDKFDLRNAGVATLSMNIKSEASGDGTLRILYSPNYFREGPVYATWEEIPINLPAKGSGTYDSIGANIPGAAGEIIYLAFHFQGGSQLSSASYDIDNIYLDAIGGAGSCGDGGEDIIFEEDFEDNLSEWTLVNNGGNNTWGLTSFNDNQNALVSSFGSEDVANEDNWLISEAIDFDAQEDEVLTFLSKTRFNEEENKLLVYVLLNYDESSQDPESATQIPLTVELDPHTGSGFGNFTPSGDVGLCEITGVGHLAFRFKTQSGNDESGWELDDVVVTGNQ